MNILTSIFAMAKSKAVSPPSAPAGQPAAYSPETLAGLQAQYPRQTSSHAGRVGGGPKVPIAGASQLIREDSNWKDDAKVQEALATLEKLEVDWHRCQGVIEQITIQNVMAEAKRQTFSKARSVVAGNEGADKDYLDHEVHTRGELEEECSRLRSVLKTEARAITTHAKIPALYLADVLCKAAAELCASRERDEQAEAAKFKTVWVASGPCRSLRQLSEFDTRVIEHAIACAPSSLLVNLGITLQSTPTPSVDELQVKRDEARQRMLNEQAEIAARKLEEQNNLVEAERLARAKEIEKQNAIITSVLERKKMRALGLDTATPAAAVESPAK